MHTAVEGSAPQNNSWMGVMERLRIVQAVKLFYVTSHHCAI